MLDEHADIFLALAQRRHVNVNHAQPVQQVLAELTARDHVRQIAVRRRNDAHIHRGLDVVRADGLNLAVLQEAEEQRLHAQAHLTHFVEEQRAAMRELELAGLVSIRARETALHVTEQFGLEQGLGQARAVHRDVRARRTRGPRVNLPRDEILADAALTRDEHLGVAGGHTADQRQDLVHL